MRSSIKTAQSLWIDSICYETMCGECYYQMGVLDQALLHYTNALQLYQRFPDWMLKVKFYDQTIRPAAASARKAVPWGVSSRQSRLGSYPSNDQILQVTIDANQTIKRGTMVQQGYFFPITPHEIIRCTALALRRRAAPAGARGQVRSAEQRSHRVAEPSGWTAKPLVGRVGRLGARIGADRRRKGGAGDRLLAAVRVGCRRVRSST